MLDYKTKRFQVVPYCLSCAKLWLWDHIHPVPVLCQTSGFLDIILLKILKDHYIQVPPRCVQSFAFSIFFIFSQSGLSSSQQEQGQIISTEAVPLLFFVQTYFNSCQCWVIKPFSLFLNFQFMVYCVFHSIWHLYI
jgi:hypothetical protein